MSARMIFRSSDFEAPIEISRRSLAFVIVLGVLALGVSHLVAWYGGSYWTIETARAEAAKIATATRANPATYVPLLDCSSRDYLEYRRTCRARTRAGEIK
jgi:hypothetical protein